MFERTSHMPQIWYAVSLVADRTGEWINLSLSLRDSFFYVYVAQHHGCREEVGAM